MVRRARSLSVMPRMAASLSGSQDNGQGTTGHYVTGLDNTKWDKDNIVEDRAATEGQLKDISESINNISNTVGSGTREFVGDSGSKVSVKLGESMNLKGGAAGELSDGNIGVVTNSNKDGFDIKLAKDLKTQLGDIEYGDNKRTDGFGKSQHWQRFHQ